MFELHEIHQALIIIADWGQGEYNIEIPAPIISTSASPSLPQSCWSSASLIDLSFTSCSSPLPLWSLWFTNILK